MVSWPVVINVFHIITSTDVGGAEMMLGGLLSVTDRTRFAPQVVSLTPPGAVAGRIEALGVPVHSLRMARGWPNPMAVGRLARLLRGESADIVQTWMYHADLVGGLAARMAGVPVVWNIRHSNLDPAMDRKRTIRIAALLAYLSRTMPVEIITNSSAAKDAHVARGYAAEKITVIPNGFDTTALKPDAVSRHDVRRELGAGADTPLVGLVARFSPHKDHRGFLRAASRLRARMPQVEFVLCGAGMERSNPELLRWIEEEKLNGCVHLLGPRADVGRINAALDVATSSSRSESFPTAVGEAMACGVPCVVTDVGDSRVLVGDCGWVVAPGDADALAAAWFACLQLPAPERRELGLRARRSIEERFGLPAVAGRYQDLYLDVLGANTRSTA